MSVPWSIKDTHHMHEIRFNTSIQLTPGDGTVRDGNAMITLISLVM